jgi:hypothetical protein
MGSALGLKYDFNFLAQLLFEGLHLPEQLAYSNAEGSRVHVSVHGMFLLLVSDFKQIWKEFRNFIHDQNIKFHENTFRISRVVT